MATLARSVHVKDPTRRGRTILLSAGEEPAPELAVQILNPRAWEGGKLPTAVRRHLAAKDKEARGQQDDGDQDQGNGDGGSEPPATPSPGSDGDTPPATTEPADAKKAPARKPAPRRTAADKGTGGQ